MSFCLTSRSKTQATWVRLKQFGQYAEVWFDIEEGIVIRCKAADAGRVVEVIRALAACHEIPLNAEDEPLVTAMQSIAGGNIPWGEALLEVVGPAGFQWNGLHWVLAVRGDGRRPSDARFGQ